jgi:hypothetical protein
MFSAPKTTVYRPGKNTGGRMTVYYGPTSNPSSPREGGSLEAKLVQASATASEAATPFVDPAVVSSSKAPHPSPLVAAVHIESATTASAVPVAASKPVSFQDPAILNTKLVAPAALSDPAIVQSQKQGNPSVVHTQQQQGAPAMVS